MKTPRLENWVIELWGTHSCALGHVYDSDRFPDGELIRTSYLLRYSLSEKKLTTKNTHYILGTPSSEFTPPPEDDVALGVKLDFM